MTRVRTKRAIRPAFTLVELMVAMALSIGIMWILAESFKMGIDFTRYARSTGQMMTQLNGVGAVMSRDLQADHFYPDDNKPNRGVRLIDQRLDWLNATGQNWVPPTGGFFRLASPPSALVVPTDASGFSIDTATNHYLHFTSILAASDQNLFSVNSGGNTYSSRSAEVAYFLVPSGLQTSPVGGQTLYNLIRRQRLVATTSDDMSSLAGAVADTDVIASNGTNTIYTLADVRDPNKRVPYVQFPIGNARYGEDLLLSNVLSFEVLVDWSPNIGSPNVAGSTLSTRAFAQNTEAPFDNLYYSSPAAGNAGQNSSYASQGVFDTWYPAGGWNSFTPATPNANKLPLAVRVKQIQVTIRMFDPKTKQSRQNTWKFGP